MAKKREQVRKKLLKARWLFFRTSFGISLLLTPLVLLFFNPVLSFVKYHLRIGNGSVILNLMLEKIEGPRFHFYVFNITNPKEFIAGTDTKMKMQEIGPFAFQEYRMNEDMVIEEESNQIKYTPRAWVEFIPEESVGDPKDYYINTPSITLMQGANLVSPYPFIIRNLFNMLVASLCSKAVVNISVLEFFRNRHDPLLKLSNKIVPGILYFKSSGVLDIMFDPDVKFTTYVGTNEKEKMQVKKVVKWRPIQDNKDPIIDDVYHYNNTYEGALFPSDMTPSTPMFIYRQSVCKNIRFTYKGTTTTDYGSEALVFDIANDTLNQQELCFDNGKWCPTGLISLSSCFLNFPAVVSRGHFLDADPRLLDRFEGFKPDKKLHSTQMIVDPKIGATYTSNASVQVSLFVKDVAFNVESRPFQNMLLPLFHVKINHPHLPPVAIAALLLLYKYKPYLDHTTTALCLLLGTILLVKSFRKWQRNKPKTITHEIVLRNDVHLPLM